MVQRIARQAARPNALGGAPGAVVFHRQRQPAFDSKSQNLRLHLLELGVGGVDHQKRPPRRADLKAVVAAGHCDCRRIESRIPRPPQSTGRE